MEEKMFVFDHISGGLKCPFVVMSYKDEEPLRCEVNSIVKISKKFKDSENNMEAEILNCFYLVNRYLNYRESGYRAELFSRLKHAYTEILHMPTSRDLSTLPYKLFHDVLDLFDLNDIFDWIKNVERLKVPDTLRDEFDEAMERDQLGTREQTYLKEDYLRLAAMSIPIKVIFGLLGQFGLIMKEPLKEVTDVKFLLFNFIETHAIYDAEPMTKLREMIEKIISQSHINFEEAASIVITQNMVSQARIPVFYLSYIVLESITLTSFIHDTDTNNIATRIYNVVNSKLTFTKPSTPSVLRDKKTATGSSEGGEGENEESQYESYNHITNQTRSDVLEIQWACSDIDRIYHTYLPEYIQRLIDFDDMVEAQQFLRKFIEEKVILVEPQLILLSFTSKLILDPRNIKYLDIQGVMNLLSFGYAYSIGIGFAIIGLLMTSIYETQKTNSGNEIVVGYSAVGSNAKMDPSLKEQLNIYFNCFKQVNNLNKQSDSSIENTINNLLVNRLRSYSIRPTAPLKKFGLESYNRFKIKEQLLPSDIRNIFAGFLIKNEEIYEEIQDEVVFWNGREFIIR